jgi:hypothetical protein
MIRSDIMKVCKDIYSNHCVDDGGEERETRARRALKIVDWY